MLHVDKSLLARPCVDGEQRRHVSFGSPSGLMARTSTNWFLTKAPSIRLQAYKFYAARHRSGLEARFISVSCACN